METAFKLTEQEVKVSNYLIGKTEVPIEELAQFSKSPQTVKKGTLQKIVSDLRRKYQASGLPVPFYCRIVSLNAIPQQVLPVQQQVQIKITKGGYRVPITDARCDAHIDFILEPNYKRVRTRNGMINLSDSEWEMFVYFHSNVGRKISIDELKEKLVFKHFGSKTPHHWAETIKRTLTKLRRNIPELKSQNRLATIIGPTTFYMLD